MPFVGKHPWARERCSHQAGAGERNRKPLGLAPDCICMASPVIGDSPMSRRLIPYDALAAKCITYSKPHLWRLEKADKFPKRVAIGAGRYGYVEAEIDAYIEQKIVDRDAKTRVA
jgi:prophage regulatory protein